MRTKHCARRLIPVVGAVLTLCAGAAAAQGRGQGAADGHRHTFADQIEVRVVNLEAVVEDRSGNRVSGLTVDDFILRVDGRAVSIGFFTEIDDGVAVAGRPSEQSVPGPVAPAGVEAGEPVGTSYLVFVDSYFTTHAARRNQVLDEIEGQLGLLGPDDRMAVVTFGGRRLEVLTGWSGSIGELQGALDRARRLPARGFITDSIAGQVDRERVVEAAVAAASAAQSAVVSDGVTAAVPTAAVRRDGLPTNICNSIHLLELRVRREVMAVTAALRGFARPPGRKVMLVLSGGWPHSVKDYLVSTAGPFAAGECKTEGPRIYRPIYDTANQLGYTLYPVDIPPPAGLAVNAAVSAPTLVAGGSLPPGPIGAQTTFDRTFEEHTTLTQLAAKTGGKALLDGASSRAFDQVVADTRSYYWMGFTPTWKGDDEDHDIKLTVNRPGLRVRSRRGYVDLSRRTEVSYVTESALLLGDLPGASGMGLVFGPLPEKMKRRVEVPVILTIPLDRVAMLQIGDSYVAELELRIGVLDDRGNRNEMPVIPVVLEGESAPPPGSHAVYETVIRMRPQDHDIVVSLYDPLSDVVMAATGRIAPSRAGASDRVGR